MPFAFKILVKSKDEMISLMKKKLPMISTKVEMICWPYIYNAYISAFWNLHVFYPHNESTRCAAAGRSYGLIGLPLPNSNSCRVGAILTFHVALCVSTEADSVALHCP